MYLDLECTKIEEEHAFAMVYFVGREGFNEVSKRAKMFKSEGCGTYFCDLRGCGGLKGWV